MHPVEAAIHARCQTEGWGFVVREDHRHGPNSPEITLLPDGTIVQPPHDSRWWSACVFTLPHKEIVAVTDEVHGDETAHEAVLRQLLSRLPL
ncbi:MAG: hypothetical protein WKF94_06925 [Solirubrobacteraceae bacterium]